MSFMVSVADTAHRYACEADESLLDAAQRAGLELPYSCRKGVCGNCRGRVEHGDVVASGGEKGLSAEERAQGDVLFCRTHPRSDLVIRPTAIRAIDPASRKRIHAKVYRVEHLSDDVSLLRLRFPAGVRARFRAGQYLQVILADGERREFSMANPPAMSDEAHLHIRHVPGGRFTEGMLPSLKAGDMLEVELAFGDFTLRDGDAWPIVFVATGTGLAPVASMLEDLWRRKIDRAVELYWGGRTLRHLYALDMVRKWQASHPSLRVVTVLSESRDGAPEGTRSGLVHEAVLQDHPDLSGVQVYACGSPAMTRAAREAFVGQAHLPPRHFFSDAFVSGPVEAQAA